MRVEYPLLPMRWTLLIVAMLVGCGGTQATGPMLDLEVSYLQCTVRVNVGVTAYGDFKKAQTMAGISTISIEYPSTGVPSRAAVDCGQTICAGCSAACACGF